MKEKFSITFKRNDQLVAVTNFDNDEKDGGITLKGETSAFPRGFGLSVTPANEVTEEKVWRVQQRLDWLNSMSFKLNVSKKGSRLLVEGVDDEAFPAGRYDIEFVLSGVRFKRSELRNVRIPEGGSVDLTFEEKRPKHRFELNTTFGKFDAGTQDILQASEIDGLRADKWIKPNVRHRDLRKACLMNILAKLAVVPTRQDRLNKLLRKVIFVEADRIYAEVEPAFFDTVKEKFLAKDKTVHSTHKRLLKEIPGSPRDYRLRSHREAKGSGSLQIIGAVPKPDSGLPPAVRFVDIDIDEANPSFDLARFFIHFGHLFRAGKTNHLKLRRKISQQTSDFLYYNAVKV